MRKFLTIRYTGASRIQKLVLDSETHEWEVIHGSGVKWRLKDGAISYFLPLHRVWEMEEASYND